MVKSEYLALSSLWVGQSCHCPKKRCVTALGNKEYSRSFFLTFESFLSGVTNVSVTAAFSPFHGCLLISNCHLVTPFLLLQQAGGWIQCLYVLSVLHKVNIYFCFSFTASKIWRTTADRNICPFGWYNLGRENTGDICIPHALQAKWGLSFWLYSVFSVWARLWMLCHWMDRGHGELRERKLQQH